MVLIEIREVGDFIDVEILNLVELFELEVFILLIFGCIDLGLFLFNLVYCYVGLMRELCIVMFRVFVRVSVF